MPEVFQGSPGDSWDVHEPLRWWTGFQDPTLDRLIDSVLAANLDLVEAVARVEEVRAQAGIAWADLFPSLQAGSEASYASQPANTGIGGAFRGLAGDSASGGGRPSLDRFAFTTYSASLGFSWELDFWGRARNEHRAATADLLASTADLHAARLAVLSETISTYFEMVQLRRQVALTAEIVSVLQEREELTERRYDRGLVTSLELYQVRLDLRSAQATLPTLEARLTDVRGRLAVLTGRHPGQIEPLLPEAGSPVPFVEPIGAGIPADLLLQRPDVRASAERLQAARYRVGARKAQLLPSLSISGSVGQQSGDVPGLFDAGQWFTNLLAGVSAPIFQAGRLRSNVEAAEAQHLQAATAFGRAVLTSVAEVESALAAYRAQSERHAFFEDQVEEARSTTDLSARRYASGVAGYADYLDALRQLLSVRSSQATVATELALARLSVHRALGGGWTEDPRAPALDLDPADEVEQGR
ncbi:MAG: TolC family protein [Longimicrobiales bacterium]|nr:TolC family protein [Longimicrobiales bacterium]